MGDKPFLGLAVPFVSLSWIHLRAGFPQGPCRRLSLAAFVFRNHGYASPATARTGLYCYRCRDAMQVGDQRACGRPTSALAITIATSVVAMADGVFPSRYPRQPWR
jgi:hypothetical protein